MNSTTEQQTTQHSEGRIAVEPDCIVTADSGHDDDCSERLDQIELSLGDHGHAIVMFGEGERLKANAARIALCWNSHDELIAAVKQMGHCIDRLATESHRIPDVLEILSAAAELLVKAGGAT